MSRRIGTPAFGLPSGPIAVTWIDDCDPPSWLMLSGSAATLIDSARSEGPVSPRRLGLMHGAAGERDRRQQERGGEETPS